MADKLMIDLADGTATRAPLTADEEAEIRDRGAAHAERTQVEDRRRLRIEGLTPNAALRKKIRDGTSPSDAELTRLVYWLAARELGPGLED